MDDSTKASSQMLSSCVILVVQLSCVEDQCFHVRTTSQGYYVACPFPHHHHHHTYISNDAVNLALLLAWWWCLNCYVKSGGKSCLLRHRCRIVCAIPLIKMCLMYCKDYVSREQHLLALCSGVFKCFAAPQ